MILFYSILFYSIASLYEQLFQKIIHLKSERYLSIIVSATASLNERLYKKISLNRNFLKHELETPAKRSGSVQNRIISTTSQNGLLGRPSMTTCHVSCYENLNILLFILTIEAGLADAAQGWVAQVVVPHTRAGMLTVLHRIVIYSIHIMLFTTHRCSQSSTGYMNSIVYNEVSCSPPTVPQACSQFSTGQ
jgi:hypothetical protein